MVIYLRDEKGTNFFEVEFFTENEIIKDRKVEYIEVRPDVYATNCFELIINKYHDKEYLKKFMGIFSFLEDLRGWYYESYLTEHHDPSHDDVLKILRAICRNAAEELGFYVVED